MTYGRLDVWHILTKSYRTYEHLTTSSEIHTAFESVHEDKETSDPSIIRFRPYNMENRSFSIVCHNQPIISNIVPEHADKEAVKDLYNANEKLADYLAEKDQLQTKRKGMIFYLVLVINQR